MEPIRTAQLHRQGRQHVGQIDQSNTSLRLFKLEITSSWIRYQAVPAVTQPVLATTWTATGQVTGNERKPRREGKPLTVSRLRLATELISFAPAFSTTQRKLFSKPRIQKASNSFSFSVSGAGEKPQRSKQRLGRSSASLLVPQR